MSSNNLRVLRMVLGDVNQFPIGTSDRSFEDKTTAAPSWTDSCTTDFLSGTMDKVTASGIR